MKYTGCFSRREIESFIPPKDSALICISDPEPYNPPKVSRVDHGWDRITFHQFWDVDKPHAYGLVHYKPASEQDLIWLKQALDLAKAQHCFVSCEAGISRSAAVREYLFRRGWEPYDQNQKNRMVQPNNYILASLEALDRNQFKGN